MISGNMVGSYSQMGKTLILLDENGNEITGVVVDQETIFTAGDNDVREGMVYASDDGVSTGTKDIPIYYSTEGNKAIPNGKALKIIIPDCEYTKLQCIICSYNKNIQNSVNALQVVINDTVYNVQSIDAVSTVTVYVEGSAIDFGITNTTGSPILIRYFTFREVY
jgi:hypothetical protein